MAAWSLHEAIYETLTSDAVLMAAVVGVYDHVPQADESESDADFPYVVIGEDTLAEWDTDDSNGFEATCTITTWSRKRGRKQTKEIQSLLYDALHRAEIVISGYHLVTIDQELSESFMDPDGLTRQGVQRFRVLFERTP